MRKESSTYYYCGFKEKNYCDEAQWLFEELVIHKLEKNVTSIF
jgi:hypothetical protein